MVCDSCACRFKQQTGGDGEGVLTGVSPACLYAMQYVVGTPSAKLYRFSLKEEAMAEFGMLVGQYIKKHVGRKMKSLLVLETMGFAQD